MISKDLIFRGIEKLVEKVNEQKAGNKIAFNVLIKDSLPFLWVFPNTKDNINTTYRILISSIQRPDIYFMQKITKTYWGIQLPFNRETADGIDLVRKYIDSVKEVIDDFPLKIVQENIPDFLRL